MEIEEALRNLLLADSRIVATVATRIYPQAARESEQYPQITFEVTDSQQEQTLNGTINLWVCEAYYACHSEKDYGPAKILAKRVWNVLKRVRGPIADGALTVQGIFLVESGNQDDYESSQTAEDLGIQTRTVGVRVWYAEAEEEAAEEDQ